MYHIAFFFDYYDLRRKGVPFLRKKLGHFLNDDFSEAYLLKGDNTQLMGIKLSEQALPEPAPYSYDHPWFIHGGLKACDGTVQHPRLSLYTDKSLLDINGLFACLARRFHWVIFPWGGVFPFGIFAFVTTDSGTRDSFVGCTDNFFRMTPWYSSGGARMTRHDMLISSYDADWKIGPDFKAVLFLESTGGTCHRLWESGACAAGIPLMAYMEFQESFMPSEPPWCGGGYEVLDTMGPFEETGTHAKDVFPGQKVSIYRFSDKKTFMNMGEAHDYDIPTHAFFPADTSPARLPELFERTESWHSHSDLCHINDYLSFCEWVCMLDRGPHGAEYSLFVSRDSSLIKKFVSVPSLKDESFRFELISCF